VVAAIDAEAPTTWTASKKRRLDRGVTTTTANFLQPYSFLYTSTHNSPFNLLKNNQTCIWNPIFPPKDLQSHTAENNTPPQYQSPAKDANTARVTANFNNIAAYIAMPSSQVGFAPNLGVYLKSLKAEPLDSSIENLIS
jgi:hypothetical protein